MIEVLKSVLTEYGVNWAINRSLYAGKLKMMKLIPKTELFFEKKVDVKRIGIFNFDLKPIKDFLLSLDEKKQQEIIETSDKAIKGVITGFSSIELNFGNPINWQLNPLTGYENSCKKKWYNIKDFDEKAGDIKIIWEASRLTHFLFFVRSYLITNDIKYYKAYSKQLDNWLRNNPYSYGSNYKCGQEATLRMINVLITFTVFNQIGLTTEKDYKNVKQLVTGSYKKVLSNFFYAHKCIKNNHTFTEILGLIIGAWCTKDRKRLEKAYKLMDQEINEQFLEDGGFTQYSFNYHRFTLQILECLFKVSEATGLNIKEKEKIKNSILLLYQVQEEKGDVPNYGSNDGSLIFPLSVCDYRDFRPTLNSIYALLEGKRLYSKGNYDEELLWFGDVSEKQRDSIPRISSSFPKSGYYTLRNNNSFLFIPLQNYKSRPAHMDQLHIDLWHRGMNLLCDTGTFSYASTLGEELASTVGHNIAKLSNTEQMNKKGAFLVTNWTERKEHYWNPDRFVGEVESKNGYKHNRSIYQVNNGYLIKDEIITNLEQCELILNTPCDVTLKKDGIELTKNNVKLAFINIKNEINVEPAYRSLYYLKKETINRIRIPLIRKDDLYAIEYKIILY